MTKMFLMQFDIDLEQNTFRQAVIGASDKFGVLPPPLAGQGNRMWPVFGERAQHRNRNRVVRATLESSRALARTIRIQNFHMRLPWLAGEGWGGGMHARMWDCTPPPCPSPASGGGDDVAPPVDTPVSRSSL